MNAATIPMLFMAVYPTCLLWAAIIDITSYKIPNRICLILAAAFFPCAILLGLGWPALGWHIGVAFLALVIGFGLFAINVFGGGDAKLMPAALLWVGPEGAFAFIFYTALAGGALALFILFARRFKALLGPKMPSWVESLLAEKAGIPYGVAIAVGGLGSLSHAVLWQKLLTMVS